MKWILFYIYIRFSSSCCFFVCPIISLRKRLLTLRETFMRIALSYRQASESPPNPFQGCVGPLSACHLGFFHNISNSRRMTWATYHTPQAAYNFTGKLFHIAIFTLNNYLIKRRKIKLLWLQLSSALPGRRQSSTIILFGMTVSFIISSSMQLNKPYNNIHFS